MPENSANLMAKVACLSEYKEESNGVERGSLPLNACFFGVKDG